MAIRASKLSTQLRTRSTGFPSSKPPLLEKESKLYLKNTEDTKSISFVLRVGGWHLQTQHLRLRQKDCHWFHHSYSMRPHLKKQPEANPNPMAHINPSAVWTKISNCDPPVPTPQGLDIQVFTTTPSGTQNTPTEFYLCSRFSFIKYLNTIIA